MCARATHFVIRGCDRIVITADKEGCSAMAQDTNTETAASLAARAERCRALARVAYFPLTAQMLIGLAQQLDGEAQRTRRPVEGSAAA
jgi:hypothetical protein